MTVAITRSCVPDDIVVPGATASRAGEQSEGPARQLNKCARWTLALNRARRRTRRGPPMITTPAALAAAADEVVEIGVREAGGM